MTAIALFGPFVGAVLLHNAEEAIWLPRWSKTAGRWHPGVGHAECLFGGAVLSLLLIAIAALATNFGPQSVAAYIFFGYVFAMVANALAPHLAVSIAMRRYMPGTASALLLNLPLGSLLLFAGVKEKWVTFGTLAWAAPVVALVLLGSIPLLFSLGRALFARQTRASNTGAA
jgi:hypothetical protein